ncbi:hypothetical protein [Fretibacter rubidus]|uniref:hypothetical protein n=1 Tax=Fretibacter rubidus TaxID=570162 RepID=UPI00352AE452
MNDALIRIMQSNSNTFASSLLEKLLNEDASRLREGFSYENSLGFPSAQKTSIPNYKIVIDACVMRNEIRRYISAVGNPTFIQEVHRSGVGEIYAPKWIETELITSTLPSLYKSEGVSPRILERLAESLLEEIIIPSGYDKPEANNLPEGVDTKDEPYARLARDINALGILSWDKGFKKYHVSTFKEDVLRQMQHMARLLNSEIQIRTAGKLGTIVTTNVVGEAAKTSYDLIKKVPRKALIIGGIAAGGAGLIYLTKTNHGLTNRRRYLDMSLDLVGKAFEFYMEFQNEIKIIQNETASLKALIEEGR